MPLLKHCALAALLAIALADSALAQQTRSGSKSAWARFSERTKSLLGQGEPASNREIEDRAVRRASHQEPQLPAAPRSPAAKVQPPTGKSKSWFSRTPAGPSRTVSQYMSEERP